MSSACPLWNQVLYQTCLCDIHTVTRPLSRRQTYTQVWRHNLTWQQKLCNNAPPHRLCTADRKNRNQAQHKEVCSNVQIHMYTSIQQAFFPILFPILCPLRQKSDRVALNTGPLCSEPASQELPILEDPWYQQPLACYTHQSSACSVGVTDSNTQGVITGRTQ